MTPERWTRVQSVLETALDLPPGDRPGYLTQACGDDEALREEVQQLMRSARDADEDRGFLEQPAAEFAAPVVMSVSNWEANHAEPETTPEEQLRTALADRYAIEREVGRGGMATVLLARDLRHGRRVALKVMKQGLLGAATAGRFLREIRLSAHLTHPHILPLHDSGDAGGILYFVMPYLEGGSLRARLVREITLPVEESRRILREVASAMDYAHREGIVHRDIKPENILFQDGHAMVADFGTARAIGHAWEMDAATGSLDTTTQAGLLLGTPAYMSPEQGANGPVDGRTDIYSLGCVLYEMLAGEPPFTGASLHAILARHMVDPVPSLRTVRPDVPARLEAAITKALAKRPKDRFQTAAEFVGEV